MGKKQNVRSFLGNSIVKNLLMIAAVALCLLLLTLLFLHLYTRHSNNVLVPSLHGLQINEAKTILKSKGLHVEVIDSIYQKDAVPGAIISQTPKPENKVKEGRAIYVTIYSRNPQQIAVPGVVDYSSRQAIALLNSIGFTQVDIELAPSQYSGLVLAVKYRGKTLSADEKVPAGASLKLVVGSGGGDSGSIEGDTIPPVEDEDSQNSTQRDNIDKSFF